MRRYRPRRELPAAALPQVLERAAVEELHHEERRPVLRDVVVHDEHGARVLHRVADVPLAQEALLQVLPEAQLRVQDLDGELGLVPVRGGEDRGHPADAEHPVRGGTSREASTPALPRIAR